MKTRKHVLNMKQNPSVRRAPICFLASVLLAAGATTTALAATPALQGQVALRPLTPQEVKDYSLTGIQGASGLANVGVGQPAYLDALINIAIPRTNIVGVTWVLTNPPVGSLAVLVPSPLGTNVPIYKSADRSAFQLAGRTCLRPDLLGQYTVIATITTADYGT